MDKSKNYVTFEVSNSDYVEIMDALKENKLYVKNIAPKYPEVDLVEDYDALISFWKPAIKNKAELLDEPDRKETFTLYCTDMNLLLLALWNKLHRELLKDEAWLKWCRLYYRIEQQVPELHRWMHRYMI